jgi:hypothetical protein
VGPRRPEPPQAGPSRLVLGRLWLSPSSVDRVLSRAGLVLPGRPRPPRSAKKPWPEWVQWRPNQLWCWDASHFSGGAASPIVHGAESIGMVYYAVAYVLEFYGETIFRTSEVPGSYVPAQTANITYMDQGYERWPMNAGWISPYDSYPLWYQESGVNPGPTFTIWDGPS